MTSPAIEAMACLMGDVYQTFGQLGHLKTSRPSQDMFEAQATAALKALEENITDEMVEAGVDAITAGGGLGDAFTAMLKAAREESQ